MNVLPFARPDIGEAEIDAVSACLRSGWLTSGQKVKEFEDGFASYIGVEHAIAVSSATAAALLIMQALGISEGDDVVVPDWTFSGPVSPHPRSAN